MMQLESHKAHPVSSPRKDMAATDDLRYVRLGFGVVALTFGVLLLWAGLAPLSSAVVASGRLVAASDNKVVQHLDGGLVRQILVADGDIVGAGDTLLRLDPRPLEIERDNVERQLFELLAGLERLRAERDGAPELIFSASLMDEAADDFRAEVLRTQQALFRSRRAVMTAERDMLGERASQAEERIAGIDRIIRALQRQIALIDEDLGGLAKLKAENLVAATKVRESQGRRSALLADVAERETEAAALRDLISENRQRIELRAREFARDVATELRDLQTRGLALQARRESILDQQARLDVVAPNGGKIKGFSIVTSGAVIEAGAPILEIVPLDSGLRIHARISPMDVDVVHPGMRAEIRLPAVDGSRHFPVLHANLADVSADAYVTPQQDDAYYKAVLALHADADRVLRDERVQLLPGMPVDVYIKTGERTLLDYLTRPFQDLMARALNEA
jgi:HlyD family type I secretion membrane fusion protein